MLTFPEVARPGHVPEGLVFPIDIYNDPRIHEDVQASYAELVQDAPDIFWTPHNGGHWMVREHDKIVAIANEPEFFSSREMQFPRVANPPRFVPLNYDPPDSSFYRRMMMPFFKATSVRQREGVIREIAVAAIERVRARGQCDFLGEIAAEVPVAVFMDMMGMDRRRLKEFRKLADTQFKARTQEDYDRSGAAIMAEMAQLIAQKRANPADDLTSQLIHGEVGGRKYTDQEVLMACFLLFLGGMDTVANAIGFSFAQLAQMPELQARLAADPALAEKFAEEGLRCYGVTTTSRLVVRDVERFGIQFKEGEMVALVLPVAGRDARINPQPQLFDIDREKPQHLTFSQGPHVCIGAILARLEMRVLTEEWVQRIPAFRLQPGVARRFRLGTVIALENLALEWDAAA